jgi:hypothetical protein
MRTTDAACGATTSRKAAMNFGFERRKSVDWAGAEGKKMQVNNMATMRGRIIESRL